MSSLARSLSRLIPLTGLGLLLLSASARAESMTFELVERGGLRILVAQGEIAVSTPRRFMMALGRAGDRPDVVCFNSPGGSVQGGVDLGSIIRRMGLATTLCTFMPGDIECSSACTFAAIGGKDRYFTPGQLGVHQHYTELEPGKQTYTREQVESSKQTTARLLTFSHRMGIGIQFMAKALLTPPADMYYLNAKDLREMGIADPEGSKAFQDKLGQVPAAGANRLDQKPPMAGVTPPFLLQLRAARGDGARMESLVRDSGRGLALVALEGGLELQATAERNDAVRLGLACRATGAARLTVAVRTALPLQADTQAAALASAEATRVWLVYGRGRVVAQSLGEAELDVRRRGLGSEVRLSYALDGLATAELTDLQAVIVRLDLDGLATDSVTLPVAEGLDMLADAMAHCVA